MAWLAHCIRRRSQPGEIFGNQNSEHLRPKPNVCGVPNQGDRSRTADSTRTGHWWCAGDAARDAIGICTAPITCHRVETCDPPYGWSMQDCACELGNSPIILDIDGKGFDLTSAAGGVTFDISGTGHPIRLGWTAPGANNAFLALPGADGIVQNGKQLFGNATPQPPSDNPNGFAALAVYDLPANGGNGDGVIDSRDAIFPHLRLWIDANHDGICQPGELHTLPPLGVNPALHTEQEGRPVRQRVPLPRRR